VAKEVGLPKNAPKKVKEADEKLDKKNKVKEGSKVDLKMDRRLMAEYKKGGKKNA